jgi:aryl-alcohol dehydrogenase-like predicted oxidoreductase
MSDEKRIVRREAMSTLAIATVAAGGALVGCNPTAQKLDTAREKAPLAEAHSAGAGAGAATSVASPGASGDDVAMHASAEPGALRKLGRTGADVEAVSLGGEGILRTTGRSAEAVPMILEALRMGVRYCDTAPAYQQSQDYYGEAFRALPGARDKVTLASKTHERDMNGALRLLDDSLRRLGTDHLDIWQLHDLRTEDDLDEIFAKDGAIKAVERAKAEKRIRFVGITGHHDPAILVEAMRRYPFDTVLCAITPADPRRAPFLRTVVPEARKRGMGVVGMKVMAAGRLLRDGAAQSDELIRYAASFADTVIIGCSSAAEVQRNLAAGRQGRPMATDERLAIEARIAPKAHFYDTFKAG